MIIKIDEEGRKESISESILCELPDWFGIPESTQNYISDCREMPFWAAFDGEKPVGFIAMKETSSHTAEIYVMGVLPEYHRSGIGRKLYDELECFAKAGGYSFVQVKTVQMGKYDEYDRTNRFYMAMGFKEFECFPTLWDECNPCQIYVKYIVNK